MRVLDLFSGIGGFSLGLERAGMETVAFCEIEDYPRKVLAKHWPDVPIYEDVRNVTKQRLESDGITRIDVVTGGFPCQDISVAGKQTGIEGSRSGLWGELCRIIGDIRPKYAIVENVTALISGDSGRWFGRVLGDLAEIGYDCEWHCISASELGAHHHRDRIWIVAYPQGGNDSGVAREIQKEDEQQAAWRQKGRVRASGNASAGGICIDNSKKILANAKLRTDTRQVGREPQKKRGAQDKNRQNNDRAGELIGASNVVTRAKRTCGNHQDRQSLSNANSERSQGRTQPRIFKEGRAGWNKLLAGRFCHFQEISTIEPTICGSANGLPNYAHRIKGLGNAVVPQIPELIGRAIMEVENEA